MLKSDQQTQLNLSSYSSLYDIIIEKDNFWRQINEMVDLSFIYEEVQKNYSEGVGRPAEDPILLFKYILLKSAFKLSDRDLVKKAKVDMEMKYFLGYAPEETNLIDASTLSKFRHLRLKDMNLIDILLGKTVEVALDKGVMKAKNKLIMDSTHTNAKLIMDSTHTNAMFQHVTPREELIKRAKDVRKAVYAIDETMTEKMPPKKKMNSGLLEDAIEYTKEVIQIIETEGGFENCTEVMERLDYLKEAIDETENELEYSKDQDAKVGHKTADTSFFGYKSHIAMTPERIITAAVVTSGEKHDGKQMQTLVEKSEKSGIKVEAVIGDGAYSEKDNLQYAKEDFEYNKDAGMYVCKAGHMAIKKIKGGSRKDSKGINTQVESYFFDVEKCKHCPFRDGCYKEGAKTKTYSVKIKADIHIKHMDYMETEEFKELYANRYMIEAKNAEVKNVYGYDTAQSCGLLGMSIQGASTFFLVNMKRIITLMKG